jgi:hypothetical protein
MSHGAAAKYSNIAYVPKVHHNSFLEAVSKLHLALNGCVAIRLEMLTYYVYAPLLNRIDAFPLSEIYNFETASNMNTDFFFSGSTLFAKAYTPRPRLSAPSLFFSTRGKRNSSKQSEKGPFPGRN